MANKDKTRKAEEFPKAYDSSAFEEDIYQSWKENGYFSPEKIEEVLEEKGAKVKEPFTMTLPPPNANGKLHLGHTCGYSFQDLMGRYARMTGHPTLLLPGKDHAAIQTEAVFTKILAEKGIDKWELGREDFWEKCYEFCMNAAEDARKQEERIGLSADWGRDFFTLDPRLTEVIYETFFQMFEDGLVYRDKYIINQCPHCRTALADVDTEREEKRGIMAYFTYSFKDEELNAKAKAKNGYAGIQVATSRPETMLGDTAVAVHPEDERYAEFIGEALIVPFVDREVKVIADEKVDPESGTGAVKITPAHAPVDFDIARDHDLEIINVINERGLMYGDIPERFKGLDTIECSKQLCAEMGEMGILEKVENIKHQVTVCERCGTHIQPIISYQWFVDVKPLAKDAIEALDSGETKVIPEGQQSALRHFFDNIIPWCISRQLWWGQRIPVWYSGGKKLHDWMKENPDKDIAEFEKETGEPVKGSGKVLAQEEKPEQDSNWSGDPDELWFEQEEDVFDTWFSSGQWPFSTLGGPESEDFKKYYPTQVMETARDILFWWVARMMMLGIYRTGKSPFRDVFLHGLINAEDGSKMSKSKGNGKAPGEVFEDYGADALRLWYYLDSLPGSNTPLRMEKIKGNRNFVNKIWNASRFMILNIHDEELEAVAKRVGELENEWSDYDSDRVDATKTHMAKMHKHYQDMDYHLAAEKARDFFWGTYCDVWIEEVKDEVGDEDTGAEVRINALAEMVVLLKKNLAIMHPMIPYVTESIWKELNNLDLADGWLIVEQLD